MTRTRIAGNPLEAALLLSAVATFLIYLLLVSQPPIWAVENATTISECGPGENPRTALCYDSDLPSE